MELETVVNWEQLSCGCWEFNLGPLEDQSMLLTTHPFLLPLTDGFFFLTFPFGSQILLTLSYLLHFHYSCTPVCVLTSCSLSAFESSDCSPLIICFLSYRDCSARCSVAVCRTNGLKQTRKCSLLCKCLCYLESRRKGAFSLNWFWWGWV